MNVWGMPLFIYLFYSCLGFLFCLVLFGGFCVHVCGRDQER